jgi:hypothetical protein
MSALEGIAGELAEAVHVAEVPKADINYQARNTARIGLLWHLG